MKHRTQVLLDEAQYQALSLQAAREGTSVSDLIRRMVQRELAGEGPPDLSPIMGIGRSGGGSARDHDDDLYGPLRK